jgi:cytochrome c biogenesis protein CcmG/thiol:disulfide interchange protein DsbE
MKNKRRVLYPLLAFWGILLIVGFFYVQNSQKAAERPVITQARIDQNERVVTQTKAQIKTSNSIDESQSIAAFDLPKMNGGTASIKDKQSKPLVIEFVASWCPHCRAMAPIFAQVMPKTNARYIIVSAAGENRRTVETWHQTFLGKPMPGELLFDDGLKVSRRYGIQGYPTTFFINKEGKVISRRTGEMTKDELKQLTDSLS